MIGLGTTTLRNIYNHLEKCYASHVGIEFKYISDQKKVDWLTNEIEKKFLTPLPLEKKKRILEKLNQGVMFEKFLHTKYVGQKNVFLAGRSGLKLPLHTGWMPLSILLSRAMDVQEVVIGMAHRGRLNVLANIMGKTYEQIFSEFEGTAKLDQTMGSGDVKYHMGFSWQSNFHIANRIKRCHLKLMPNPSHLEAVDPVGVWALQGLKLMLLYAKVIYDKILTHSNSWRCIGCRPRHCVRSIADVQPGWLPYRWHHSLCN